MQGVGLYEERRDAEASTGRHREWARCRDPETSAKGIRSRVQLLQLGISLCQLTYQSLSNWMPNSTHFPKQFGVIETLNLAHPSPIT